MTEPIHAAPVLLAECAPQPLLQLAEDGHLLYANRACQALLESLSLQDGPPALLPEHWNSCLQAVRQHPQQLADFDYTRFGRSFHCTLQYLPDPHLYQVYLTLRPANGTQLPAFYDTLTGLPSRAMLEANAEEAARHAGAGDQRAPQQAALFLVSLDRFQETAATLGADIGDQLITAVGERLRRVTQRYAPGCVEAYRFETSTFALLVADFTCLHSAGRLRQAIETEMQQPFSLANRELYITITAGISFVPMDAKTGRDLIAHAEAAMNRAKASGNRFQPYNQAFSDADQEWLFLDNALHQALSNQELVQYYQPQVNTRSGEIIGVEALMRWYHPERGIISPETFIPIAEENGLIREIGEWSLHTACEQFVTWQQQGLQLDVIAVNVSAVQFADPEFYAQVCRVLKETGMPTAHLEVEITESLAMQQPQRTAETLKKLKALGIKVSIDDFGTGYSSLSYLTTFPIDALKVDQSFVRKLLHDKQDAIIAHAVIELAHRLHMTVIVEGVETREQQQELHLHTKDEIQGYMFSRPVSANEMTELLRKKVLEAGVHAVTSPSST